MSELPEKLWLRRGEVRSYLNISEQAMTKLVNSHVLKPKYFPGMTHAFYAREDVLRVQPEPRVNSK